MNNKNNYIIPIFVPHEGCKNDCVFCNQKRITGISNNKCDYINVDKEVRKYMGYFKREDHDSMEIAFYGGSFTGIDIEKQNKLLKTANNWIDKGLVQSLRLSTRPDYINKDILTNLRKFNVKTIELGVQSLDEEVLINSKRGHTKDDVYNAVHLIKEMGFNLGLQMMVGLPGDTSNKSINTAKQIVSLNPDFVRIYPTLVIKGTELEDLYKNNIYKPLSLQEAVEICKELYTIFSSNDIKIIRLGLQPSENIMEGKDVISGPFHPSFRQLVESAIIRDYLVNELEKIKKDINNELMIYVNPKIISSLVGNKRSNLIFIKNYFNIKQIKIGKEESLNDKEIKIVMNNITYNFLLP